MTSKRMGILLLCALVALLSGCTLKYGDSLLAAPRLPEEYDQLQRQLDAITQSGQAFLVPADTGSDRQAIQLKDLDGDGENEAVAFFRTEGNTTVYIFALTEDGYQLVGMDAGPGYFRWVRYPRIDSHGNLGVAVARGQEALTGVTVYRMGQDGLEKMLDTSYSQMTISDLEGDGTDELLLIHQVNALDTEERYALSIHGIREGAYKELTHVDLCKDVRSVINIIATRSMLGRATLYVDSRAGGVGNYVTDIIEYDGLQAVNLTMDLVSGEGSLSRAQAVLSRDISGDGVPEVPVTDRSEYQDEPAAAKETRNSQLIWMAYEPGGTFARQAMTYHNVADAWYLLWPEIWGIDIYAGTITQNYRQVTKFYALEPDPVELGDGFLQVPVLYIYVFTGVDREQHYQMFSNVENIEFLWRSQTAIYGYAIPDLAPSEYRLGDEAIKGAFGNINTIFSEIY